MFSAAETGTVTRLGSSGPRLYHVLQQAGWLMIYHLSILPSVPVPSLQLGWANFSTHGQHGRFLKIVEKATQNFVVIAKKRSETAQRAIK